MRTVPFGVPAKNVQQMLMNTTALHTLCCPCRTTFISSWIRKRSAESFAPRKETSKLRFRVVCYRAPSSLRDVQAGLELFVAHPRLRNEVNLHVVGSVGKRSR